MLSNVVVVAVMLLRPQKLRSTHVLIMALAASDIMFSLVRTNSNPGSPVLSSGRPSHADCHKSRIRCCHAVHFIRQGGNVAHTEGVPQSSAFIKTGSLKFSLNLLCKKSNKNIIDVKDPSFSCFFSSNYIKTLKKFKF